MDRFPVLSESFILNQATGLIDRGHDVDLYAFERGDTVHFHEKVRTYGLLERLCVPPHPPTLVRRSGDVLRRLWRLPTHKRKTAWRTLYPCRFGKEALRFKLFYQAIPWLERTGSYDIVHAQFGMIGLKAVALKNACVLGKARLITHFRGWDSSAFVREVGEAAYARLWQAGDLFLANSDFFKRRVLDLGAPPDRTEVLLSGIDLADFHFSPRSFPAQGVVRLLTVGRLTGKKGIQYAVEAVALLRKQGLPIEYRIVGDGPQRGELEVLIARLGMKDCIHLLGWLNHAEIQPEIAEAHLFAAPSVTSDAGDQDGPLNVLKEAMASGLPVVSTWHGGIPELVEDGVNGFLVSERNPLALAEKLAWLIKHPDRWPDMGRAGRKKVEAEYDKDRIIDRQVRLYEQILDQPPNH